jgi:flagellar biosynthetic protein FlhB
MTASERTHEATTRRRQQAREAGQVAHSQDLAGALLLLGALGLLVVAGASLVEFLADLLKSGLGGGAWKSWIAAAGGGERPIVAQWNALVPALMRLLGPVLAGTLLVAVGVHLLQRGFLFRPQQIVPDLSRASPLAGLRRIFSGTSVARLVLGVAKVGAVAGIALGGLWGRRTELAALAAFDPPRLAAQAWEICWWTGVQIGAALLVLAVVDWGYERWRLERELRMTPQEMREETRELEGNRAQRTGHRDRIHRISARGGS